MVIDTAAACDAPQHSRLDKPVRAGKWKEDANDFVP
jgi:hypothetical protein